MTVNGNKAQDSSTMLYAKLLIKIGSLVFEDGIVAGS
jgi:hypothetical protein